MRFIWKLKIILRKEYTEHQINEMDSNYINILSNKYESVSSPQMTKSLGKSVINLNSNIACSALGVGNQQDLRNDLECDPLSHKKGIDKKLYSELLKTSIHSF